MPDHNAFSNLIRQLAALLRGPRRPPRGNHIRFGDSFTGDRVAAETCDYFLTNPPFGVDWKQQQQKKIEREHDRLGFGGHPRAGLPRVNDGTRPFSGRGVADRVPVRHA